MEGSKNKRHSSPLIKTVADAVHRLPEDGLVGIGAEAAGEGVALLSRWFTGGLGTVVGDIVYATKGRSYSDLEKIVEEEEEENKDDLIESSAKGDKQDAEKSELNSKPTSKSSESSLTNNIITSKQMEEDNIIDFSLKKSSFIEHMHPSGLLSPAPKHFGHGFSSTKSHNAGDDRNSLSSFQRTPQTAWSISPRSTALPNSFPVAMKCTPQNSTRTFQLDESNHDTRKGIGHKQLPVPHSKKLSHVSPHDFPLHFTRGLSNQLQHQFPSCPGQRKTFLFCIRTCVVVVILGMFMQWQQILRPTPANKAVAGDIGQEIRIAPSGRILISTNLNSIIDIQFANHVQRLSHSCTDTCVRGKERSSNFSRYLPDQSKELQNKTIHVKIDFFSDVHFTNHVQRLSHSYTNMCVHVNHRSSSFSGQVLEKSKELQKKIIHVNLQHYNSSNQTPLLPWGFSVDRNLKGRAYEKDGFLVIKKNATRSGLLSGFKLPPAIVALGITDLMFDFSAITPSMSLHNGDVINEPPIPGFNLESVHNMRPTIIDAADEHVTKFHPFRRLRRVFRFLKK